MKRQLDLSPLPSDDSLPHEIMLHIGEALYDEMDAGYSNRDEWAVFVHFTLTSRATHTHFAERLRVLSETLRWCSICVVRPADYALNCLSADTGLCRMSVARERLVDPGLCDCCAVQHCVICYAAHCGCAIHYYHRCTRCKSSYCGDCADYKCFYTCCKRCPTCGCVCEEDVDEALNDSYR